MNANRISMTITDAQKDGAKLATKNLAAATNDFTTNIDKETLKSLAKLGDTRIPCVEKVSQYAVTNPEFLPTFADVDEFNRDFKTFMDMREIVRPMRIIVDNMEATMQLSGSEAWEFARNYYNMVKFQTKMGVPGAQTIYDDLRPLFERRGRADVPGDGGENNNNK